MMKGTVNTKAWENVSHGAERASYGEDELSRALRTSLAELSQSFDAIMKRYKEKRGQSDRIA